MDTATKEPPPPASLTERQQAIYDWVVTYCETHGYSPTFRELCKAFGIKSPNGAFCHLKALRRKGWLCWGERSPRTLRPIGGVK